MRLDITTDDGAIMYRLEGTPVGAAGSKIPERITSALRGEFDDALTIEKREDWYVTDGGEWGDHEAPTPDYDAVVVDDSVTAVALTQLVRDDIAVYSDDDAFSSKFHLHDNETGGILTQVESGASVDWDTLLDLRGGVSR